MSDEGTRTGFGFGLGADGTRSASDKKIQIRLANGKVYGPYVRPEVISFIEEKKLKGDELILVEGARDWVPITSDLEFFDAFQARLVEKSDSSPKQPNMNQQGASKSAEITKTEVEESFSPNKKKKEKHKGEHTSQPKKNIHYSKSGEGRVVNLGQGRSAQSSNSGSAATGTQGSTGVSSKYLDQLPFSQHAQNKKKKNYRSLVLLVAVVIGVIYWQFAWNKHDTLMGSRSFGTFQSQSLYARPLMIAMDGFVPRIDSIPSNLISSPELSFPEGFNATVWIEDLKWLERQDPKAKLLSGWWLRWAWDAYWLGMSIGAFDRELGESYMNRASAIVARIQSMGILKEPAASMFNGAREFGEMQFEKAAKMFELVSAQHQMAAWLEEESKWQMYWLKGAKGAVPTRVVSEYDSGPLEMSSQVRAAFIDRNENRYKDWVDQLAVRDPLSNSLWFTTAQVNWRFNKTGSVTANKLFSIGLGSLALHPQPVQIVYWSQFAQFISSFGRQATVAKVRENRDAIKAGNLERDPEALKKWWDLNKSEFNLNALASEVFLRAERGALNNRDMATLFVLGYVVPSGGKYLAVAGNHFALEQNWEKAQQIFNQIVKIDKSSIDAWGGLVWVYSSLFKFDDAFQALDEISRLRPAKLENLKFEALLYSMGREYAKATEVFEQYISRVPNDPWAHFFNAKNFLAQEQNVKCVTSANLALTHARGEIAEKSNLLLYRCRVLAKIQSKEAMLELKKMAEADPNNPAIVSEFIDAQLAMDLDASAAEFTENAIRRFPRSYDLRMKRGDIYKKNADYDRAVAFYSRAARDRPDSIEPMIKIAQVLQSQGKVFQAAESFEAASFKSPDYPEVFLMAARAYAKARRIPEASRLFEKEIGVRPSHVAAFLEAAQFFLQHNDPNSVIRLSAKLSPDYQEHPQVRARLAQTYFALRQIEKAVEEAQRTISLDPKVAEAHRVLGLAYEEMGQYDLARRHLEQYLLLAPGAADGSQIRGRLNGPPFR